jgi:signal transduction histidine kinase
VDVSKLLEDIGEGYTLLAAEKNLQISWQTDEGLTAFTDADLLRQVMHNLLGNALRYARSKVKVRAWAAGGVPVLAISNDCDPRTMATTGLGLGLRLVRGICASTGMSLLTDPSSAGFSATLQIPNLPAS